MPLEQIIAHNPLWPPEPALRNQRQEAMEAGAACSRSLSITYSYSTAQTPKKYPSA